MTFVMKTFLILAVSATSDSGSGSGAGSDLGYVSGSSDSGNETENEDKSVIPTGNTRNKISSFEKIVSVNRHSNNIMSRDIKNVAYSCSGNLCRSAAAHIFTEALNAAGIDEFCPVNAYSFANAQSTKGVPATEYLLSAMKTREDNFVTLIEKRLDKKLTAKQSEQFKEHLREASATFRVSVLEDENEQLRKLPKTTVYVAEERMVDTISNNDVFKHFTSNSKAPKIELMKPGEDVADEAWMAKQMLETWMLREVLKAFPKEFESRTGPFEDGVVTTWNNIRLYKQAGRYIFLTEEQQKELVLTAGQVGFIYHNLEDPKLAALDSIKRGKKAFEYDGNEVDPHTETYEKNYFPYPNFFNREKLVEFLKKSDKPEASEIVTGIEHFLETQVKSAYGDLAEDMLNIVMNILITTCKGK